jgi:cyclophilin family peptidyl-prolyl cis-trans isomerase
MLWFDDAQTSVVMAKHKLPTQVEIAATADKSEFAQFVDRWWKAGLGLALLIASTVLVRQYMHLNDAAAAQAAWDTLRKELRFSQAGVGIETPSSASLFNLGDRLRTTPAGAWARVLEVEKRIEEGDWNGATEALAKLRSEHPDHPLCVQPLTLTDGSAALPITSRLEQLIAAKKQWREAHSALFGNPVLPAGSPKVRMTTSAGSLVLQLASERAPLHCANFLKLCSEGYYVGVKFHRIDAGMMIQGGDPNSRGEAVETWGLGGPTEKLAPESSGLFHFPFVLSTAKSEGDPLESGSQFFITVADAHHLDGKHSVFGTVIEGQDVVRAIANAKVVEGTDRPESPVIIEKTEVL